MDDFLWDGKRSGIKHNALINDYSGGGLKKLMLKLNFKLLECPGLKDFILDLITLGKLSLNIFLTANTPMVPSIQI